MFVRATSSLDFGLGAAVSAKGAGGPGGAGGGGRVALIYGNSTTLRVEAVDVSGGPGMSFCFYYYIVDFLKKINYYFFFINI